MIKTAKISDDGLYRYQLTRQWGNNSSHIVTWIMLNPSTADDTEDDPTIRRCIGFSQRWGFDGLHVVNLYAYRSTNPSALLFCTDPYGPENDRYLQEAVEGVLCIAAWGAVAVPHKARMILTGHAMHCLGHTKQGCPRHPLYVKGDTERMAFRG